MNGAQRTRARWRIGTGGKFGRTTNGDLVPLTSSEHLQCFVWGEAPGGLATYTQLADQRLRPTGDPVAYLEWRRGERWAHLYDATAVRPIRPMTEQQRTALAAAMIARRTCTECGRVEAWCLPTNNGRVCTDCDPDNGTYHYDEPAETRWETTTW